jgi:hypothetical protein
MMGFPASNALNLSLFSTYQPKNASNALPWSTMIKQLCNAKKEISLTSHLTLLIYLPQTKPTLPPTKLNFLTKSTIAETT